MTKTNTVAKITKKDNFAELRALVELALDKDYLVTDVASRLTEFIDHEVEQLEKRSASAKKYAKKNDKATDELTEACVTVLSATEGALTIPEIVAQIDETLNATPQKLTYRLNKLVELGTIEKGQVSKKEEGKPARKVNCYAITGTMADAE